MQGQDNAGFLNRQEIKAFRLLDVIGLEKMFSNGKGCVGTLQLI